MPSMNVERRVSIRRDEREQRLPAPVGTTILSVKLDDYDRPTTVLVETRVNIEASVKGRSGLRVRVTRKELTARTGVHLLAALPSANGTYFVYECNARRNVNDIMLHPLAAHGVNIVELEGKAKVNLKLPVKLVNGRPHLVYKSDMRAGGTNAYVFLLNNTGVDYAKYFVVAQDMVRRGVLVELTVGVLDGYSMFVATQLIPSK